MNVNKIVKDFRFHLRALGYKPKSVNSLHGSVERFLVYIKRNNLNHITPADIINYYDFLKNKPNSRRKGSLSEITISHEIQAIKTFFNHYIETGKVKMNPFVNLHFKKPTVAERSILSQDEIYRLFRSANNYEEKAIMHLFYSCGLRRSEVEMLNSRDINFNEYLLYVREGKGNHRRVVPMTPKVTKDLLHYLSSERKMEGNSHLKENAFILNSKGHYMRGDTFYKRFKALMKRAGISKSISLHDLRHSIATHLSELGMPFEYIREFLGHKFLDSTQVYTHVKNINVQYR